MEGLSKAGVKSSSPTPGSGGYMGRLQPAEAQALPGVTPPQLAKRVIQVD